jgi:nitrile hydratase alpha subunit
MSEQKTLQEQIVARAMEDEAFRQELLSNPKAAVERGLGITLPQGMTIQVYEDTPDTVHIVLPMKVQSGEPRELSDAELEQAVGGAGGSVVLANDDGERLRTTAND